MIFASSWSDVPWPLALLLLFVYMAAPFLVLLASYRSLRISEPLPLWLLALLFLFEVMACRFMWKVHFDEHIGGFWRVWWWTSLATLLLLPLVVFQEGQKREWYRKLFRRVKTRKKKRKRSLTAKED